MEKSEEQWLIQGKKKKALPTIEEEPADLIQFTADDVKEELQYWQNSVYCFILGANPSWDIVEGFVRRIWANYPIDKVSFLPNGIFLVRFTTAASKVAILKQGHFLFDNKPLIVRDWNEQVELTKENVKNVPVWVKLYNLPLKFWGKCLLRIADLVGKYIKSDPATADKTRLGFARVLLEVPFGKNRPLYVKFLDEEGNVVKVNVECEWKPVLCTVCGGTGHDSESLSPMIAVSTPAAVRTTPVEIPHKLQVSWNKNGTYTQVNTPAKNPVTMSRQEIIQAGQNSVSFS
ncbi:uncharacterized protein LOC141620324 [Silene latifolia]|uniref:uncharacterized protein LOC141620324 n=1 Tax=Silene latifolia TaxID=37657 RepID=UPI003D775BB1